MWIDDEFFEFFPILGKRLKPGIRINLTHPELGEYVVQSNNYGFRCNHDFSPSKTPGLQRILIFGDSYAYGDGVSNETRFSDVLEKLIPGVEVYNFAQGGFAVDQQYICYQELGIKFEHDLIIITPTIETIRKLTAHFEFIWDKNHIKRYYPRPYFDLVDGKLVRGYVPPEGEYVDIDTLSKVDKERIHRETPFPQIRDILEKTHIKDVVLKTFPYQPFPEYDSPDTPAWKIMQAILAEWVARSPMPILVLPLPRFIYVKGQASARNYQARFQEVQRETGCFLYDPLPDLHKLSIEQRRKLFFLEGHLTPQGHAFMGELIAPHVQDILQKSSSTHK